MARKRMIDPSLWTDERFAELTARQQVAYIGLISNADDDGRLKGSPSAIALMMPSVYMGVPLGEVRFDLDEILKRRRSLVPYTHDGLEYLVFANYREWQTIQHPTKSKLPAPPDELRFGDGATNAEADIERPRVVRVADADRVGVEPTPLKRKRKPKVPDAELPEFFPEFWEKYSEYRADGKDKAATAFGKLDTNERLRVIGALDERIDKDWRHWDESEREYIPHASSWLNQRRYNDKIIPRRQGNRAAKPDAAEVMRQNVLRAAEMAQGKGRANDYPNLTAD